ncbi:MAG: hypothetical protein LBG52_09095 [Candidatus Peribacteria bacterium]|nr:hypothetical protein [Candidatus Peribacteria bacterium]
MISVSDNYNGSCAVKVALIVCMRADVCGNSSQQCSRLQGGGLSFARGNETDLTLAVRAGVAVANIGYAVGTNGGVCTYSSSTSSSTCDYYHNANFSNGGFCVATITKYKS